MPPGVTGDRGIIEKKLAKDMGLTITPIGAGVFVGRVPAPLVSPPRGPRGEGPGVIP